MNHLPLPAVEYSESYEFFLGLFILYTSSIYIRSFLWSFHPWPHSLFELKSKDILIFFHQIFEIRSSFNSSSLDIPRKSVQHPPLLSVCLPFYKHILLQQPTSFSRSLPHTPSLTSNNILSLKISPLFHNSPFSTN